MDQAEWICTRALTRSERPTDCLSGENANLIHRSLGAGQMLGVDVGAGCRPRIRESSDLAEVLRHGGSAAPVIEYTGRNARLTAVTAHHHLPSL